MGYGSTCIMLYTMKKKLDVTNWRYHHPWSHGTCTLCVKDEGGPTTNCALMVRKVIQSRQVMKWLSSGVSYNQGFDHLRKDEMGILGYIQRNYGERRLRDHHQPNKALFVKKKEGLIMMSSGRSRKEGQEMLDQGSGWWGGWGREILLCLFMLNR